MILLTILNSIAIIIILFKVKIIDVKIHRNETFSNKTLIGYDIWINKFYIKIPIRNKYKTQLSEEVNKLISNTSPQGRIQILSAKFSWLKTWDEVKQFEKDYSVVDRKIVEKLVLNFIPKDINKEVIILSKEQIKRYNLELKSNNWKKYSKCY